MKIVAIAGGVGGAKLADGLAQIVDPRDFTVIVNTGDDFEHCGLRICPDLDTVCYTLAGLANPVTGWGRNDETWVFFENLKRLGGPDWFRLGDQDLATHIERTNRLRKGETLSEITAQFCSAWGVTATVLPMTDDEVATWVKTEHSGLLPFQEYFVKNACQPKVTGFDFRGAENALPAPGVVEAIEAADEIVICPSNPWVSIGPVIAIPAVRKALEEKPCIAAVSPIIGGQAVKGPAAKMYAELGITPSALEVARHYSSWVHGIVIDEIDRDQREDIQQLGLQVLTEHTLMQNRQDRAVLAGKVLDFCTQMIARNG